MDFPISGVHINPFWLIGAGFIVGVMGGFFGVGGSFLAAPTLFVFGVPANFVVGTDLTHIVGKSIVAAKKHWSLGNIDMRLAAIMVVPTMAGSELGVQLIEYLKKKAYVDQVVGGCYLVLLTSISCFMFWESWKTVMEKRGKRAKKLKNGEDSSAFSHIAKYVQKFHVAPMVKLKKSGVRISAWAIVIVSLAGGFFSGFLGGGAGYIRMPSMVYLLGIPTHIAVGTDLFEIAVSASYGTFRHALKGNVDILIALVMHTGAAVGAQIGATGTAFFHGAKIRMAFAPLPLIGAGLVLYGLITGHHH